MVNIQVLKGQWNEVQGQLKSKWSQLTDDDLRFANGNIDQLVGIIQRKTGEGREAIERYLESLTARGASMASQAAETAGEYGRFMTDQMREGYNQLSDQLGRQYEMSREMIRENPGQSVATAFGLGILVGVVIGLALHSR